MTNIDGISEVAVEDLNVSVRPGITRNALNRSLRETGLFFPIGWSFKIMQCSQLNLLLLLEDWVRVKELFRSILEKIKNHAGGNSLL